MSKYNVFTKGVSFKEQQRRGPRRSRRRECQVGAAAEPVQAAIGEPCRISTLELAMASDVSSEPMHVHLPEQAVGGGARDWAEDLVGLKVLLSWCP